MIEININPIYLSDKSDLDHDLSICSIHLIWIMICLIYLSDTSDLEHYIFDLTDLFEFDHDLPDISVRSTWSDLSV